MNLARQVMSQLLDHGKVTRGYLGLWSSRSLLPWPERWGKVNKGRPLGTSARRARTSGRRGTRDIIVELNGKSVNDANELRNTVSMMQPGET